VEQPFPPSQTHWGLARSPRACRCQASQTRKPTGQSADAASRATVCLVLGEADFAKYADVLLSVHERRPSHRPMAVREPRSWTPALRGARVVKARERQRNRASEVPWRHLYKRRAYSRHAVDGNEVAVVAGFAATSVVEPPRHFTRDMCCAQLEVRLSKRDTA